MENDNLQRIGDVVISNNEDGNKRHNASDGKFAKKEIGDGSVAKELSDSSLDIKKINEPSVYQDLINNNVPFEKWPDNAKNHFIDDKLAMEYYEQNFIPKIMEKYGYKAYRNLAGTEYDELGVDYVFLKDDGSLIFVDLKNVNASFDSKNFLTDSITLRTMQTVFNKETQKLELVDGFLLNPRHINQELHIQMLNAGMSLDEVGKTLLSGESPDILKHSFFTIDSAELKQVIFNQFGGEDALRKEITENLEGLMKYYDYFDNSGYKVTKNSLGQTIHIDVPITKIGSIVTSGAKFAYDIKYDEKGNPTRYTCTLIMPKSVASSKYLFKKNQNYTPILTKQ